jgi:predicted amidohydrolase
VGDKAANLRLAARWVRFAAARGADLVVFPECFVQGYTIRREVLATAEEPDGPTIRGLSALARSFTVAIVAGFIEQNQEHPARPFNSAAVIDRGGRVAGVYRKTHLFRREHEVFARGDNYPTFDLHLTDDNRPTRVGVCICADIEYPEVARLLALGGAQLVCVPSADMDPYRAQQAANLASRAIENNVYVALANTVDRRANANFFGGSGIAGPDGSLVSAGHGRPRLAVATLSDAAVAAWGGRGAYLRERRPETYRGLLDPVR